MSGDKASSAKVSKATSDAQARQRSSISFPYVDLGAGADLAIAIHSHVGHGSCSEDQLAAWTDQSSKSSGFREQIRVAKMAGLIEEHGDELRLADLGRLAADPDQARAARARAFLTVPLFKAVYDKYRGSILPPAAALERDMVGLGVSEKQKDRARQVMERSAEFAGFFESGRNKLVMPANVSAGTGAGREQPRDPSSGAANGSSSKGSGAGSGAGSGGGPDDPLINALIQKLPTAGPWPVADRVNWLKMLAMAFQMSYGQDADIEIKEAAN